MTIYAATVFEQEISSVSVDPTLDLNKEAIKKTFMLRNHILLVVVVFYVKIFKGKMCFFFNQCLIQCSYWPECVFMIWWPSVWQWQRNQSNPLTFMSYKVAYLHKYTAFKVWGVLNGFKGAILSAEFSDPKKDIDTDMGQSRC